MRSSNRAAATLSEIVRELRTLSVPFVVERYLSSGSYGAVCAGTDLTAALAVADLVAAADEQQRNSGGNSAPAPPVPVAEEGEETKMHDASAESHGDHPETAAAVLLNAATAVHQGANNTSTPALEGGDVVAVKRVFTTVSDGRTVAILADSFLAKRVLREVCLLAHFHHPNILSLRHLVIMPTGGIPAVEALKNKADGSNGLFQSLLSGIPPISSVLPTSSDSGKNALPLGDSPKLYLVTDLMKTDLAQVITDSSIAISTEHIRYFLYQVFLGLHALHEAGVVHRDLHPGNILLSEENDVKICDFNLAREDTPGDEKTHYVTHRWYRAPELVMQYRGFSKKVDIWSAGCVMAELYNRKTLFRGTTFYNQLNKIIEVVGTPVEATMNASNGQKRSSSSDADGDDLALFSSQSARDYLRATLSNCPAKPWNSVCPTADDVALDLLSKLLVFNPARRITADQALRHPFFEPLFNEADLTMELAPPFHFNEQMTSVAEMQQLFISVERDYQKRLDTRVENVRAHFSEKQSQPQQPTEGTPDSPPQEEAVMSGGSGGLGKNHVPRTGSFLSLGDD